MKHFYSAIILSISLAACAANPPPAPVPEPAPEPVPVVVPPPEPPPPPPKPEPTDLLGLSPAETQALLGEPSLVRWEGAAQVRQFSNDACVFDLYFQEENPGEVYRIIHMDARSRSGVPVDRQDCLIALLPGGDWPDGVSPKAAQ